MAALVRSPLTLMQQPSIVTTNSPFPTIRKLSSAKRARSPEPTGDTNGHSAKRAKAVIESVQAATLAREESKKEKARSRAEKEQEFRIKYARAFPNWVFHFDLDLLNPETASLRDKLQRRVIAMGARVDDFFSRDISHLITLEYDDKPGNKENAPKSRTASQNGTNLASPIKLRGRTMDSYSELVQKALAFDVKVWSAEKLSSVLDRCQLGKDTSTSAYTSTAAITTSTQLTRSTKDGRALSRLLESEKIHGTTERDPQERRHGYHYFSKNSYFVLVEDMKQELATITALEYPITREDSKETGSWPVLYCHPLARGPFVPYDEKEERKRARAEQAERDREREKERRKAKVREMEKRRKAEQLAKRQGDLRRTVSMNNLHRRATCPDLQPGTKALVDLDAGLEDDDSLLEADASGYMGSGAYVAASGNSVSIASTTGTTSTAGIPFRSLQLPPSLKGKLQQQVLTKRKLPSALPPGRENSMGPPLTVPDRPARVLRKSRSTNTMRLPKRNEDTKPGYCESCRTKFEDFKNHIQSKRHRKFATNDANFAQLDSLLSRLRRRTTEDMEAERRRWGARSEDDGSDADAEGEEDDMTMSLPSQYTLQGDSQQWRDWVDASCL